MSDEEGRSARNAKKCAHVSNIIIKQEIRARMKQVNGILKKPTEERTDDELRILEQSPDIANAVQKRTKHRQLAKDRTQEIEDPPDVITAKCHILAKALKNAKTGIIYSGAGISTAASIPDYRGPKGVWTMLQKGMPIKPQDLSDAEPTITHMSITKLHQEGKVKHVVSQNCDGLHLRSGFPRYRLSEVHGNMYIEVCKTCKPGREYIRLFDVTERTSIRRHKTCRMCHVCGSELRDTIIHFGEKAPFTSPYNWEEAAEWADEADFILCLGSSLKVVKKYGCLWNLHKPFAKRPKLFIVNLQWTPKDDSATLKINGRCDDVMSQLMAVLGYDVPAYDRWKDPIFKMAVQLYPLELKTTSKKIITQCLESDNVDHDKAAITYIETKPPALLSPVETGIDSTTIRIDNSEICIETTEVYVDATEMCKYLTADRTEVNVNQTYSNPAVKETLCADEDFKPVEGNQLRAMLALSPSVSLPTSGLKDSPLNLTNGSIRDLIRSRLQSRMSMIEQETPTDASPPNSDNTSEDKPSDKYKLIKYLLNKPADVADDQLNHLTAGAHDSCQTMMVEDYETSATQYELIHSNTDNCRQLIPVENQTTEHTDNDKSVIKSYPTLVGALMQQHLVGSISEDKTETTGSKYQTVMGSLCSSSNADAISKLRSLMEGRPKMEPLLIETEVSTAQHVSKQQKEQSLAQVAGATPGINPQLLLTTVLPASDHAAMLLAYMPTSSYLQSTESTTDFSCGTKRCSESLDDSISAADIEQTENISPSQKASIPGWFGKGLSIRKRKKKIR